MEWNALNKKRPVLSLSKTRTKKQKANDSTVVIKHETLTQPDNQVKLEATAASSSSCNAFKLETTPVSNQQVLTIKDEPDLYLSQDKGKMKEVVKEEEGAVLKKEEYNIKEEEQDVDAYSPSTDQTNGEYNCPICNSPLASNNQLRQRHIDKCLDGLEKTQEREEVYLCFICNKDLSFSTTEQREIHINRCLDEKQAEEKRKKDMTFAGQQIPYMDALKDCPVCHATFKSNNLTNKMSHLKKCARKNNISAELLKQKCRWIEWGHAPVQQEQASSTHSNPTPSHFYSTSTHNDDLFGCEADDDFSDKVIIHRTVSNKAIEKQLDAQDEELQAALAISLSLQVKKPMKKPIQPNATDIFTPEESRKKSLEKLNQIQCKKKAAPVYNIRLYPSRFEQHTKFWKLASLQVESSYLSMFLLKNKV